MVDFRAFFISQNSQGGYSGINVTGGGGGTMYFFGSKIFNFCIFLGRTFNHVFLGV